MFQRDDRIVALLQEELSVLLRSVKDPGVEGLVTLTGIELSRDRKTAWVFFSVFGDAQQRASTAKALERASDFLRRQLRTRLSMKVIPHLEFKYDDTPERAQRIEDILGQIEAEKTPPTPAPPDAKPSPRRRKPSSG